MKLVAQHWQGVKAGVPSSIAPGHVWKPVASWEWATEVQKCLYRKEESEKFAKSKTALSAFFTIAKNANN